MNRRQELPWVYHYQLPWQTLAINTAPLKPKSWDRYVDDALSLGSHDRDKLDGFKNHLNSLYEGQIEVTMEVEKDNCLPHLEIMIHRE